MCMYNKYITSLIYEICINKMTLVYGYIFVRNHGSKRSFYWATLKFEVIELSVNVFYIHCDQSRIFIYITNILKGILSIHIYCIIYYLRNEEQTCGFS